PGAGLAATRRRLPSPGPAQPERPLAPALAGRVAAIAAGDEALAAEHGRFARELVAFQDAACASEYLEAVEEVAALEREIAPGPTRLAPAVAANLFKLTAYKDEYEVARLLLDDEALGEARRVAGHQGPIT